MQNEHFKMKRSIANCGNSMAKKTGSQYLKRDFMGLSHKPYSEKRADYIQTRSLRNDIIS